MPDLKIVTFLWHDRSKPPEEKRNVIYTPEHVERLARGVRRHLTVPHEFIVITDHDPQDFQEPDRVIPLWKDYRSMGGCYTRLRLFSKEMRELIGPRILQIDLDTIVVGNIDHIVNRKVDFAIWASQARKNMYCAQMFLMDAGARAQVWEGFNGQESADSTKGILGTDQAWIAKCLGPGECTFEHHVHGVYSYHWHVQGYDELPENACLVMMHGPFDPGTAEEPWVKEHWT